MTGEASLRLRLRVGGGHDDDDDDDDDNDDDDDAAFGGKWCPQRYCALPALLDALAAATLRLPLMTYYDDAILGANGARSVIELLYLAAATLRLLLMASYDTSLRRR